MRRWSQRVPSNARLDGMVSSNAARGIAPHLTYVLRVDLTGAALLTLAGLDLGVRSWHELGGQKLAFGPPAPPELREGVLWVSGMGPHASVLVDNEVVPATLRELVFGARVDLTVEVRADMTIERQAVSLVVMARLGAVTIYGDAKARTELDENEASALAGRFVDLSRYTVKRGSHFVELHPRLG